MAVALFHQASLPRPAWMDQPFVSPSRATRRREAELENEEALLETTERHFAKLLRSTDVAESESCLEAELDPLSGINDEDDDGDTLSLDMMSLGGPERGAVAPTDSDVLSQPDLAGHPSLWVRPSPCTP